jgi:parvulin-like peptidyl-prolyl isomerase
MPVARKRLVALILALVVVLAIVLAAASSGLGDPSIPSDAVAVVDDAPNGTVTLEEFNAALPQAAARLQLPSVPKAGSPQYDQVKAAALSDLLLSRWVAGEAADRGIDITDTQIADELDKFKKTNFGGSEKKYQAFLKQSGYTEQDAADRMRLQLVGQEIQKQVLPQPPTVSDSEVSDYYDANIAQFQQPETRDFRLILNKDQAKVQQAADALAQDDSPTNWAKVAKQFSTDPTTKATGGLRQAVAQGQSEPALDEQVFQAPASQLVGPFEGQNGFYLIEVQKITPASTTPLNKQTQDAIRQQLVGLKQQEVASNFQTDFNDKWVTRTFCKSDYATERCENFTAPSAAIPGSAVVTSTRPVAPGHAAVFGPPQGLPQGPIVPAAPTPAGLPPGVSPGVIGPGGAPAPTGVPPAGSTGG